MNKSELEQPKDWRPLLRKWIKTFRESPSDTESVYSVIQEMERVSEEEEAVWRSYDPSKIAHGLRLIERHVKENMKAMRGSRDDEENNAGHALDFLLGQLYPLEFLPIERRVTHLTSTQVTNSDVLPPEPDGTPPWEFNSAHPDSNGGLLFLWSRRCRRPS